MKTLTTILKIIAIVLNVFLLTALLISLAKQRFLDLSSWMLVAAVLVHACPPVTLIVITFTFAKKIKILTNLLKVIAIILNGFFLAFLCYSLATQLDTLTDIGLLRLTLVLLIPLCPAVSLVAIALTFRRDRPT